MKLPARLIARHDTRSCGDETSCSATGPSRLAPPKRACSQALEANAAAEIRCDIARPEFGALLGDRGGALLRSARELGLTGGREEVVE